MFKARKLFQPIYGLSPQGHQAKKQTPSLGGVGILVSLWFAWFFYGMFVFSNTVLWMLLVFSAFSILGLVDDIRSLVRKSNQGLTTKQKFFWQVVLSICLVFGYSYVLKMVSVFDIILYCFVLVGSSNATNLTDGLDGLLVSCSFVTLLGFFLLGNWELQQFLIIVMIILFAFFLFNRHPAKVFMGDTGSLGVGALFGAIAISMDNVWLLMSLGAIYIVETLSVIIQVSYYKRTRKRVFLMTPLHHHFELLGVSERGIVYLFVGFSCLCLGISISI